MGRRFFGESHRSELNRRPLDYESSALPLSYCGLLHRRMPWRGLEPRRLSAPPPQDGVSTNFTTRAIHPAFTTVDTSSVVGYMKIEIQEPAFESNCVYCAVLHGSDGVRTRDLSSDSRVL